MATATQNSLNFKPAYKNTYAGDPNTHVAGVVGDFCINTSTKVLYVCTTAGNAAGAVWSWVNPQDQVVDETGSSVTMASNTCYLADDGATLVTFTLPTASALGDWLEIVGVGSGLWTIAQASGQQIKQGIIATTSGASGSISSSSQYDCLRMRCITANTTWVVTNWSGNPTYV